jgi:hypothetical protein
MIYNEGTFYKQYLSEIIDLTICLGATIAIYYAANLYSTQFKIYQVMSVIYFIYGLLSVIISSGQSIGDKLMKILLIKTKTGKSSKIIFLSRIFIKTIIIFLIMNYQDIKFITLILILLIIVPFKFKTGEYYFYSLMSFGSKTTFIITKGK